MLIQLTSRLAKTWQMYKLCGDNNFGHLSYLEGRGKLTWNIIDRCWKCIRSLKTQFWLWVLEGKRTLLWTQQLRHVKWSASRSASRHTGATKMYFQLNYKLRRINVMCTKFLDLVFTVFISRGWQFRAKHWHQKCKNNVSYFQNFWKDIF